MDLGEGKLFKIMTKTIHIIDVESGNLQSLSNAIKRIDPNYIIKFIHNEQDFIDNDSQIEKLIFPGVGNFGHFVKQLNERKLINHLKSYIKQDRPLMGICVGLQSIFHESEESPNIKGLGLLLDNDDNDDDDEKKLKLYKFDNDDEKFKIKGIKKSVPHIGWNNIHDIIINGKQTTTKSLYGLNKIDKYYFVHSYAAIIKNNNDEIIENKFIKDLSSKGWDLAISQYGSEKFISAISKNNLFATQFHPEKSGIVGLKIIKNFLNGEKNPTPTPTPTPTPNNLAQGVDSSSTLDVETTLTGLTRRIIACLDVRTNDDGDLVVTKGDQYNVREQLSSSSTNESAEEGSSQVRNLGKPVELATKYYNQGADEITFLNITSFRNSPLKDLPMLQVLKKAAETIFVPLTVGGGIKDLYDPETGKTVPAVDVAHLYFQSGADKISIGSDAVTIAENYYANNGEITGLSSIETISSKFGNQAVVISVDPKRKYIKDPTTETTTMQTIKITDPSQYGPNGEQYCYYQVTSQGGRKIHELGALELCLACEKLGAGEILLNSIDHDGSNKGFNLQLLQQIKSQVSIPVIASSGAGNPQHFQQVFEMDCGIDAALGAGLFHRGEYTVNQVKKYLQQEAKMDVRLDEDLEL